MRQSLSVAGLLFSSLLTLAGCGSPERSRSDNGGSGSGLDEITLDDGSQATEPRFSPDGATIAFIQAGSGDNTNVARMDTSGGMLVTLAPAGTYLAGPAWAPDGKQIYFASIDGISVVPANGGAATVAVNDFATLDPDVSPDGKSLVYGINGSTLKLIDLANPTMPKDLGQFGTSPRFSPDGLSIAFESGEKIMVMTLSSGDVKEVVDAATYLASVDWFPDGKRLAITSDKGLEIVTLDPAGERSLLRDEFAATNIDLSADGASIAYSINGSKSVYILTGF